MKLLPYGNWHKVKNIIRPMQYTSLQDHKSASYFPMLPGIFKMDSTGRAGYLLTHLWLQAQWYDPKITIFWDVNVQFSRSLPTFRINMPSSETLGTI
jgi:hypothetical protein